MALTMCGCSSVGPDMAGTSEQGNARVIGSVVTSKGTPAAQVQVCLFKADYNPVTDGPIPSARIDTTDAGGLFTFTNVDSGAYSASAVHIDNRTRALSGRITVKSDSVIVPADTLREPGSIKVVLSQGSDTATRYLYVPGTAIALALDHTTTTVFLDSVPAGTLPALYFASRNDPSALKLIQDSIQVRPNVVTVIANYEWKSWKKLYLNTTSSGAGVAGTVLDFPVLVRLTTGNFNFGEALGYGSDIRFAKSDGTPLPYEIERWDASQSSAELWVSVDTVFGNDSTRYIVMYYGNSNATAVSNSAAVFDTVRGFQGVWHLGQTGGTAALDATANRYDGTPFNMTSAAKVAGAIGNAQAFDGQSACFQMNGTAGSKLNFPRNGTYAISAWAYTDTFDLYYHTILSKGDYQYNLEIIPSDEWQFAEYSDAAGWDMTASRTPQKIWTYLTGVRQGDKEYLYVNGALADTSIFLSPSSVARNTGFDVMIGRTKKSATDTTGYFFKGMIDEVRVTSIAPGADWIKLCYMNQRTDDRLVIFRDK
jgi:hypothetical protein